MSTDAPDAVTTEPTTPTPKSAAATPAPAAPATPAAAPAWQLETANGSLKPRSALDVLVDLNDKVTTGQVSEYQPVPLGFTPLDKTIGNGLRAGELLLIGGAQGTGKTTMALQMARNVASGGQANVLYICFEHDEQYLLNRLIAMESALAHLPHKTGAIKIQDVRKEILGTWMAEGEASAQMANNPRLRPSMDRIARYGQNLFMMRGSQTASTIENIRKLVQAHRVMSGDRRLVVMVDYLQKVHAKAESREREIAVISSQLKSLAKELDVPVMCLAQLNRRPEGREGNQPQLSDLRESGAIEQDADVVMLLFREDYYDRESPNKNTCDIIVAKNRTGPTDTVKLAFIKEYTRFENLAAQPQG